MSLVKPDISSSSKFSDTFREGQRFYLTGIRTVQANTQDYGTGTMVLLKIKSPSGGEEQEYGIWGQYLVEQANSAGPDDLNKWYTVQRRVIEGYSSREVKCIWPNEAPGQGDEPAF